MGFSHVTSTGHISENRLHIAQERLSKAIERLQDVLGANAPAGAPGDPDSQDLQAQVQNLISENTELRSLIDATATHLDATIEKFKSKLAE